MRLNFLFVALFILNFGYSQSPLFSDNQVIEVTNGAQRFEYIHKLKAKETIYSLSNLFNQSVDHIYAVNDKSTDYIFQIGEAVKIPFNPTLMTSDPEVVAGFNEKIAVIYQVKPKENLFRISRVYFPQSMDHMMANNGMTHFNLALNEKLIIGYIPLSISKKKAQQEKVKYITEQRSHLSQSPTLASRKTVIINSDRIELNSEINLDSASRAAMLEEELPEYKTVEKSEIALWDKKISDKENLFVLHRSIKPGTEIQIHYPMLNRTLSAQVVGNIPKGLYSKDVDLIISPRIAQQLGVRDSRFRVKTNYQKRIES